MNFLGHSVLGPTDPETRIGNILGDFYRGFLEDIHPVGVREGVRLHRKIDEATDVHPAFKRARSRLTERWGRFSGILVDVFFDHVLASRWTELREGSLDDHVDAVYWNFVEHWGVISEQPRRAATFMIESDWIRSYRTPEGIGETLSRMSGRFRRRTGREIELEPAVADLKMQRDELFTDLDELITSLAGLF